MGSFFGNFLGSQPQESRRPRLSNEAERKPLKKEGLAATFVFLRRKLMWVDEVRLPLTEKFQEEIGLPQSNLNLSHHFSSTPDLLNGKAQELNTPSPANAVASPVTTL